MSCYSVKCTIHPPGRFGNCLNLLSSLGARSRVGPTARRAGRKFPASVRNRLAVNRVAFVLLLAALALVGSACRGSAPQSQRRDQLVPLATPATAIPVVIEVFGTPGMRFGGAYGELGSPQSIEGTVPARLTFKTLTGFSVAFQKRGRAGELGITITVEGKQVHRSKTVKPLGVVTYTHPITPK